MTMQLTIHLALLLSIWMGCPYTLRAMEMPAQTSLRLAEQTSQPEKFECISDIITQQVYQDAVNGDAQAQYLMGRYHEVGLECKDSTITRKQTRDERFDDAKNWYEKAVAQNHAHAQYCLGRILLTESNSQSSSAAVKLFEQAANSGHILARFELASYYHKIQNNEASYLLFKEVYDSSILALGADFKFLVTHAHSRAAYHLGLYHEKKGENALAADYYLKSLEFQNDYDKAAFALYQCLRKIGKQTDAAKYLERALEKNLPAALVQKGIELKEIHKTKEAYECFFRVAGLKYTELSDQVALNEGRYQAALLYNGNEPQCKRKWLIAAAQHGHLEALKKLGEGAQEDAELMLLFAQACLQGNGLPKNEDEAIQWSIKALKKNNNTAFDFLNNLAKTNNNAAFALGETFQWGYGVEKDMNQALLWYKQAALTGHIKALCRLETLAQQNYPEAATIAAEIAAQGLPSLAKDQNKAIELLHLASDSNDAIAAFQLATLYRFNREFKDIDKSISFYQRALERGHPQAYSALQELSDEFPYADYALGQVHENGKGVQKNMENAIKLYQKAAKKNFSPAIVALAQCCTFASPTDLTSLQKIKKCYEDALNCRSLTKPTQVMPEVDDILWHSEHFFEIIARSDLIPDFSNKCLATIKPLMPQSISAELFYYIACITDILSRKFNKKDHPLICQALTALCKFEKKSLLALAIARALFCEVKEASGKIALNSRLWRICQGLKERPMPTNFNFEGKEFKKATLQDFCIDLFNCQFIDDSDPRNFLRGSEILLNSAFNTAVIKIQEIFKQGKEQYRIADVIVTDTGKTAQVESLNQFFASFDTPALKKRIIRISKDFEHLDKHDQETLLTQWAVLGCNRDENNQYKTLKRLAETYIFDSTHLTHTHALENLPLKMRLALILAELRIACLNELVHVTELEKNVKICSLYERTFEALQLVGDRFVFGNAQKKFPEYPGDQIPTIVKIVNDACTEERMVDWVMDKINKTVPSPLPITCIKDHIRELPVNDTIIMNLMFDTDGRHITKQGARILLYLFGYLEPA